MSFSFFFFLLPCLCVCVCAYAGKITDCWVTPSGREYAHIKYLDGDEEDVPLKKVGREEGKEGQSGREEEVVMFGI